MNDIKPIKFCGVDSKRPVVLLVRAVPRRRNR